MVDSVRTIALLESSRFGRTLLKSRDGGKKNGNRRDSDTSLVDIASSPEERKALKEPSSPTKRLKSSVSEEKSR